MKTQHSQINYGPGSTCVQTNMKCLGTKVIAPYSTGKLVNTVMVSIAFQLTHLKIQKWSIDKKNYFFVDNFLNKKKTFLSKIFAKIPILFNLQESVTCGIFFFKYQPIFQIQLWLANLIATIMAHVSFGPFSEVLVGAIRCQRCKCHLKKTITYKPIKFTRAEKTSRLFIKEGQQGNQINFLHYNKMA